MIIESEIEFQQEIGIAGTKRIHVEISDGCNISCPMCTFHDHLEKISWEYIPDIAKKLDIGGYFKAVHIGDRSEPLINPRWDTIVKEFSQEGALVSLQTNAKMIKSVEYAERLVKSGLHILMVSIDGINNKTVDRIRTGVNFDDIDKAIEYINIAKKNLGSQTPYLFANCVAMRSNIVEIPELVDYLVANGFVRVRVGFLSLRKPNADLVPELLLYDCASAKKMVEEIKRRVQAVEQRVSLDLNIFDENSGKVKREKCMVYEERPYLHHNGDVFTCYGKKKIGNIKNSNLDECLSSKEYREYSNVVSEPENEICGECRFCQVMALDHIDDHFGPRAVEYYSRDIIEKSLRWVEEGGSPEVFWQKFYATKPEEQKTIVKIETRAASN